MYDIVQEGDRVRSFDFSEQRDLTGPRACYIEGTVIGFTRYEGCERYRIAVSRVVFQGEDDPSQMFEGRVVVPPVNGTATWSGNGMTDYVERIDRPKRKTVENPVKKHTKSADKKNPAPTSAQLRAFGRYASSADPETVERLKAEGYRTDLLSVGKYAYSQHPDSFESWLEDEAAGGQGLLAAHGSPAQRRAAQGRARRNPAAAVWLWAVPRGSTSRLDEKPLTSTTLSPEQVGKVKAAAAKDGWHSFRTVKDGFAPPDFAGAVVRGQGKGTRRNPETPEQAAARVRAWYDANPQIRDQELAGIAREKAADAKMHAAGCISAPWGGWVKKSDWRAHMRKLAKRKNPASAASGLQFYAQPYSPDCEGFYFSTLAEFEDKQAKSHCEEYDVQFIDGTEAECDLFKAIASWISPFNAVEFLENGGTGSESDDAAVYYAIQYGGEDDLDAAIKWAEDEGRPAQCDLRDYARELVDDLGIKSFNCPEAYIDYESLGRDLMMDWDEEEQGPEPDDPEEYAVEWVKDLGFENVHVENYIDWDKLANDLEHDYTEFEFAGKTWTIRNN